MKKSENIHLITSNQVITLNKFRILCIIFRILTTPDAKTNKNYSLNQIFLLIENQTTLFVKSDMNFLELLLIHPPLML